MTDKRAWREYVAADAEYERADRQLRATAYEPAVIRALASGPDWPAALEFLSVHHPLEVIHRCLDVLLPLAIEGGSEQGDARELVLAADRSAVTKALPALVAQVVNGPNEGDAAYLAYYGLMDLLKRLEERQLLRYTAHAARQSPDPEVHSAAYDFDEDFGALNLPIGDIAVESTERSPWKSPDTEAARAWEAFARARTRRNTAYHKLLRRRGFVTRLMPHLRSGPHAGARLLAGLLASGMYLRDVRVLLRSLDTTSLRETATLIADALLADHWRRAERYRALLTLLAEIPDTAGYTAVIERARISADPKISRLVS